MANDMQRWEGDDDGIVRVDVSAVGAIVKSEVEAQIDAAKKYPRSIKRYLNDAIELATYNEKIAKECMYALKRSGKPIVGPSVRMAEICASAYGNMHVGARVIDEGERTITGQGVCWDLEKNLRISVEAARRITTKEGRRYDDDMVVMTGNAAVSIALRNSVFRVIPRVYVSMIFEKAQATAVGDAKTLVKRRQEMVEAFGKMGVTPERMIASLGKAVVDWGVDELSLLIGLGKAVADKSMSIDDAFPVVATSTLGQVPAGAPEGRRVSLKGTKDEAKEPETRDVAKPPEPAKPTAAPGEPPMGALTDDPKI
jgi:hypothetical protein